MKTVKPIIIISFLFACTSLVCGQTIFEDASGETSVFLPVGGNVRVNTADKSLKFAYYYNRSDKDVVFGVDASGKSNNGFASVISGKNLNPEANLNFNVGFKNVSTDDSNLSGYDYLNVTFGIGASKYTLLNPDVSYAQQISTESFNQLSAGVSYNYYLNGNMIFGIYGGYDKTNNISALPKLVIKETTVLGADAAGTTIRSSEDEFFAWQGNLKTIHQFSFYTDYIYIPDFLENRVALSVYTRSGFRTDHNQTNAGLGIYLNKKDEPLKVVGGIIYEFEDLFDSSDAGTSLGKRGTLGIILGYHF